MTIQDDIDAVDALPAPGPPRYGAPPLTHVALQLIAETAARAGLSCVDVNRQEDALAAVSAAADKVNPIRSDDDSPGAWERRGAYAGIVDAWEGTAYRPPTLDVRSHELYASAWMAAKLAVDRVRATEGGR